MSVRSHARAVLVIALWILITACEKQGAAPATRAIPALTSVATIGALKASRLVEASGVVRSTQRSNVFWSQNDSGNDPELFAYDSSGASLGVARVSGASNRDWEAIAIGPCTGGTCVYIGDVGDNGAKHGSVAIWRVAEPTPGDTLTTAAVELRFRYPDGPRDVEALWVSPDTSIWLLTKRPLLRPDGTSRPTRLYRLPPEVWSTGGEHVAILIDSLPIIPLASNDRTWITDASLSSPDSTGARRLAVRTYEQVYIFSADPITGRPGTLEHRCSLAPLRQRMGEGLVWLADGRLLFNAEGRGSALQVGRCP